MKLKKSIHTNKNSLKKKENKTSQDILNTIKDVQTLPKIYPQWKQERTLTGIFKHYYKNTGTINFLFGAYNALDTWDIEKAVERLKIWLDNKPLSPVELYMICERDNILSKDKLKIFKKHIKELNTLYNEFMTFKENKVKAILDKTEIKDITQDLIDDVDTLSGSLNTEFHKIILYFEKMENL